MLHVHVFLVAPLGSGHMTQSGTDQHQRRVAIGEAAYYSRPSAYFPVQPLNHIVRPNPRPMLAWKIAEGQCFLYAVLNLLGRLFQLASWLAVLPLRLWPFL